MFPTGQDSATFRDKEQKFLHCPGTKEQAQNLATEWDSMSKSSTGCGMGQSLFLCQSPGRDAGQSLFFPYDYLFYKIISCFRTNFSCFRTSFSNFFLVERFCPGTFAPALVPRQWDNGTSRPVETLV